MQPWRPSRNKPQKRPEHKETNEQKDKSRWVMPLRDRVDAIFCSDPREKESPPYITKGCDRHPGEQKEDPSRPGCSIKLAEKKGNHDGRLEGSDAAACFVNAQQPGFDLDDVSMLKRRNIREL